MKNIFEKRKNIFLGISLLALGIVLGVSFTFVIPFVARNLNIKTSSQPVKIMDEVEIKRQALSKFYNELSTVQNNRDWASYYYFAPQSVRDNLTKEQFIAYWEAQVGKDKIVSQTTTVHNIEVNGNKGVVDRTISTCLVEDCTGENRKEDRAKKEFEYVNENWQVPDPQPSERALKAANYAYENSSKSDQKDLLKMFGYGSESSTFPVRNWAVYLDKNLEELVRVETLIEQDKAEKSRPVYVQQPAPIIQQPAQIIQQDTFPTHCTSNTIGNYTYTNCY